ncbi:MAG: DUF6665 family protein [Pseudomonadota bacterium]
MNKELASRIRQARSGDPLLEAFQYEAKQEAASALGHAGKKLEAAVSALERHDATPGANTDRDELVQEVADLAWAIMIQREAFGLFAASDIEKHYRIPREAMARMGAVRQR